jgi:hypothetical protein
MQRTLIFVLVAFIGTSLYGQTDLLRKAKDLSKKTDKKEVDAKPEPEKKATPEKAVNVRSTTPNVRPMQSSSSSASAGSKEKPQVPDMTSATLSPAIGWESLLSNECYQYNPVTGYFRPVAFLIYFLPEKDMEGKPMNYNNFTSAFLPYIRLEVVNKTKGKTEGKFYYRAEPMKLPSYQLKLYENALNPETPAYINLFEGEYSLDFFIGENKITAHAFRIEKQTNADPYSPVKQMYWMRGDWEQWASISFNSDDDLMFSHYVPERNIKIKNQSNWDERYDYESQTKLYRNGTLVGFYNVQQNKMVRGNVIFYNGKWHLNANMFYRWPIDNDNEGGYHNRLDFQRKHLKDGDYVIELEIFKPSGTVKEKYKFSVKGGAVISDPRADRSKHTDPLTLVEQGVDKWFLRKQ